MVKDYHKKEPEPDVTRHAGFTTQNKILEIVFRQTTKNLQVNAIIS